jgi:hypothetical protein
MAARIPEHGWALASRYLDSPDVNLAEAALGALPWTDRPDRALSILLTHIDDDRARVAIYAAGRAARFVAPSQLYAILHEFPTRSGKITSRKETIRLLTRLAVPGAVGVLEAAWQADGQHRDVLAAVVSAARQRLDEPRVWPILAAAATGSREELRALLAAHPLNIAERYRPRYGELVTRVCHSTDDEAAAEAWTVLPMWAQWTPQATASISGRLTDLTDRTVWRNVMPAITALVDAGLGEDLPADVLDELVRLDHAEPMDTGPLRDRPARRRIGELVGHLVSWARLASADAPRRALREAGLRLIRDADFLSYGLRLLVYAAPCGASIRNSALARPWSPPVSAFAGFRFPPDIIVLAVRWYLRNLCYRDVEELLVERGVDVDHVTVFRWVQRFTPLLADAARFAGRSPGDRWFVDETYVKVNGVWR